MKNSNLGYQADIQKLCEKFNIGRHQFVIAVSAICRITKLTPKQQLEELEKVDDLEQYIVSIQFEEAEEELPL